VPAAAAMRTSMSKGFVLNEQHDEIVLLRRNDGDDVLQHPEHYRSAFVE
jgi:hypothetical protein